jgi:hypothetical protein
MSYTIFVGKVKFRGKKEGDNWIGRAYRGDVHLHSTEGGESLETCLTDARRAIESDDRSNIQIGLVK